MHLSTGGLKVEETTALIVAVTNKVPINQITSSGAVERDAAVVIVDGVGAGGVAVGPIGITSANTVFGQHDGSEISENKIVSLVVS